MFQRKNLLYSQVLVSSGAAVCAWYSAVRFEHRTTPATLFLGKHEEMNTLFLCLFLFFSTFCLYHFHEWFLTENAEHSPRGRWIKANRTRIRLGILLSGLSTILIFFIMKERTQWLSTPLFLTSLLYTAPKIPVLPFIWLRPFVRFKTIYLSLVWTYATTIFPLETYSTDALSYAAIRFVTFYIVCFLFDYRDRFHDQEEGLRSYIHSLSTQKSETILGTLLLLNLLLIVNIQTLSTAEKIAHVLPLGLIFYFRKLFLTKEEDIYFYGLLDSLVFLGPFTSLFFLH